MGDVPLRLEPFGFSLWPPPLLAFKTLKGQTGCAVPVIRKSHLLIQIRYPHSTRTVPVWYPCGTRYQKVTLLDTNAVPAQYPRGTLCIITRLRRQGTPPAPHPCDKRLSWLVTSTRARVRARPSCSWWTPKATASKNSFAEREATLNRAAVNRINNLFRSVWNYFRLLR